MTASPEKRVLVTGGTGFIGRHAVAGLLARGFEVHVTTRDPHPLSFDQREVRLHVGDLMDRAWQSDVMRTVAPTHLLHLAWYTAHGKFWTSPENLQWVQASLDLLLNFAAIGGSRIVGAGTCAEYAWSDDICSETTTPLRPNTLYGTCKNAVREMFAAYGQLRELSTAWGRVFFLYGPQEHAARLVPTLALPLLQGKPAACRCGDHVRDFMHVADVGDAFAALLDSAVAGPVNIASGTGVRLGEIAQSIARIVGQPDLLEVGAEPPTANNPSVLLADTRRLNVELGWQPRIDLEQGLREVVAACRWQLDLAAEQAAAPGRRFVNHAS